MNLNAHAVRLVAEFKFKDLTNNGISTEKMYLWKY